MQRKLKIYGITTVVCISVLCCCGSKKSYNSGSQTNTDTREVVYFQPRRQDFETYMKSSEDELEYKNFKICMSKYMYDKALKVGYVQLKVTGSGIKEQYENNIVLGHIIANDKGDEIGIKTRYSEEHFGETAVKVSSEGDTVTLSYMLYGFDGDIKLWDYVDNTIIKEYKLEDTVQAGEEISEGINISPLGICITGDDKNGIVYSEDMKIEMLLDNGERYNIQDMCDREDGTRKIENGGEVWGSFHGYDEMFEDGINFIAVYWFDEIQSIDNIVGIYIDDKLYSN